MLKIKKDVYEQLISHAKDGFPLEVCGYLGEKNGIVSCIKKMKNTDESNEHFTFDPAEQFITVRGMRKEGYKASVVYHSHPETPSRPSEEDIRLANDSEISYIIVSLADIDPVVKSFKIENSTVSLEEIKLM
ncbi:MAG: M67 family metallopeptidase [Spirochaetaceae bacterium]|nr:M67 family metallopeptidase [Spirochaetaceae bacterium]